MILETLMGLAGPWPLKFILDNVVGSRHINLWLAHLLGSMPDDGAKNDRAVGGAATV
jgi:subfamily B ATP-binding cassette protein MsbA